MSRLSACNWLTLLFVSTSPVCAVQIHIEPRAFAAFDQTGAEIPLPSDLGKLPNEKLVFGVRLLLIVSDLDLDTDNFGNAALNVSLAEALFQAPSPFPSGYVATTSLVDHDLSPFTAPVPRFADNGDFGIPLDFLNVVVGVDPLSLVDKDERLNFKKNEPVELGRFYALFDGVTPRSLGNVNVTVQDFSLVRDGKLVIPVDGFATGGSLAFHSVPEPPAFVLAVLAGFGLLGILRPRAMPQVH